MALIWDNFISSVSVFTILLSLSISSTSSIITKTLDSGRICDKTIELEKDQHSAVLITTSEYFFSKWSGIHTYQCNFKVKLKNKDYDGIYAVIQHLSLRRNDTTGECIDFVGFRKPRTFFFGKSSDPKKFCGSLERYELSSDDDDYFGHEGELTKNAYVMNENVIETTIYVRSAPLRQNEELFVQILFTAFKQDDCNKQNVKKCRGSECIWAGFAGDEYQNCPYKNCIGKDNCQEHIYGPKLTEESSRKSYGIGTQVTIGIVACVLMMLVVFACLCICRCLKCVCWSANSLRRQAERPVGGESGRVMPTAPPEPDREIKDQPPPSYESLYPPEAS